MSVKNFGLFHWSRDSRRCGVVHTLASVAVLVALGAVNPITAQAQTYVPPVGIPPPPFGINETNQMYAGDTYAAGGFQYLDAGNGPYTHYVDDRAACTNTNNNFGTAVQPRCSIPTTLPEGSVVEVHGGPYSASSWTAAGTPTNPVFIRGGGPNDKAIIDAEANGMSLDGTYLIVEYMDFPAVQRVSLSGDFISFRHSFVHDRPGGIGQFVQASGNNGVIFGNEITGNGGTDRHGVGLGGGTSHNWILENNIHHNSGDAIQFCHGCIGGGNGPAHVYIGRNQLHEDHENGIDIKESLGPVVISENRIWGYQSTPTSNGEAIRLNDEGAQGTMWIIANEIFGSRSGIQPQNSHGVNYIIGNLFHDITNSAIGADAGAVIGNTFHNVGTAIGSGSEVRNNIIMTASTHIAADVGPCSHNLAYQSGAAVNVDNGCTNQLNVNPLFVNAAALDFHLQPNSPARDSGMVASQYQTFLAAIGVTLAVDQDGEVRPQGGVWDRGAFEYAGGVVAVPTPAAPTSLVVQ